MCHFKKFTMCTAIMHKEHSSTFLILHLFRIFCHPKCLWPILHTRSKFPTTSLNTTLSHIQSFCCLICWKCKIIFHSHRLQLWNKLSLTSKTINEDLQIRLQLLANNIVKSNELYLHNYKKKNYFQNHSNPLGLTNTHCQTKKLEKI